MSTRWDSDLDDVLRDTDLLEVAHLLSSYRAPEAPIDPAFKSHLRRTLMQEAWDRAENHRPWWRHLFGPRLAWAGAGIGAALIAVAALTLSTSNHSGNPSVTFASDGSRSVAVVTPLQLSFSQPMDHASVEASLQIQPATQVTYTWQGNTLLVTPKSGSLAPNTQYKVSVAPSAHTSSGQALAVPKTFVFVTTPLPTPPPTVTASPTPIAGLADPVRITSALGDGATIVGWVPQLSPAPTSSPSPTASPSPIPGTSPSPVGGRAAGAGTLYAVRSDNHLVRVDLSTGTSTVIAGGVRTAAVSGDGTLFAYAGAAGVGVVAADGSGARILATADSSAVAWKGDAILYVTQSQVYSIPAHFSAGATPPAPVRIMKLAVAPSALSFSPGGDRLIYRGDDGFIRLANLGSQQDTAWSATATGLPVWAPSGARVAEVSGTAVIASDPSGGTQSKIADLSDLGSPGAVAIAWSAGDRVLLSTGSAIYAADPFSSGARSLGAGSFGQPVWSPDGSGFVFLRGGFLWSDSLAQPAEVSAADLVRASSTVVDAFMAARRAGDATLATSFLDSQARSQYSANVQGLKLVLPGGDVKLGRSFSVLSQVVSGSPAQVRVVVRMVETKGSVDILEFDETLLVRRTDAGVFLIHDSSRSGDRRVDAGPEVISVTQISSGVQITFDSDLEAATVATGVHLLDRNGRSLTVHATYANRVITLVVPDGFALDQPYQIALQPSLSDALGRSVPTEYRIPIALNS